MRCSPPAPPRSAAAADTAPEAAQPFSVQDLVRLDRISEIAAAPDGKRVAYTLRTTDIEANKARTAIWVLDVRKRDTAPARLTDLAANSTSAQWSADGRFVYYLSNRSGSMQVWRAAPGGEPLQITNLPLDVGSFRISPKSDRVLVSLEVYPDCATLDCTKQRLDAAGRRAARGVLYDRIFVRHWDAWSDGRRSQLFAIALDDAGLANGTPVNLTAGIDGDVPSKPFGGRDDYAISPDGRQVAFSVRAVPVGEPWSTNFDIYTVAVDRRNGAQLDGRQPGVGQPAGLLARRLDARLSCHRPARIRGRPLSSGAAQSENRRQASAHAALGPLDRQLRLVA